MKTFLLSILAIVASALLPASAQDDTPLPFPVKVGGQAATYKKGEPFAKLDQPVANNADLQVEAKAEMIIVNVGKVNAQNEPDPAKQPAVILLQGTNKSALDKTMDGKKLEPGNYLLSISAGERTATIKFTVK